MKKAPAGDRGLVKRCQKKRLTHLLYHIAVNRKLEAAESLDQSQLSYAAATSSTHAAPTQAYRMNVLVWSLMLY